MTRTRVFYGHEGVVPPTGLRARSGGRPGPEVDEVVTIEGTEGEAPTELTAEAIELPDNSWKVPQIDAFAEEHGIEFPEGAKKPEKLAAVEAWAATLPELTDESGESDDDESTEDDDED